MQIIITFHKFENLIRVTAAFLRIAAFFGFPRIRPAAAHPFVFTFFMQHPLFGFVVTNLLLIAFGVKFALVFFEIYSSLFSHPVGSNFGLF